MITHYLKAPKINNNDDSSNIIYLSGNGVYVNEGDLIATFESTKATYDLQSPAEGYFFSSYGLGEDVKVGNDFGYLTDSLQQISELSKSDKKVERLISNEALSLINKFGVNQAEIPGDGVIDSEIVKSFIYGEVINNSLSRLYSEKDLVLYCAGNHAEVIYEAVALSNSFNVVAFIDYSGKPSKKEIFGIPVLSSNELDYLLLSGVKNVHVNTNSFAKTMSIYKKIKAYGAKAVSIFHPTAVISPSAKIGENVFIGANSIVGTNASIGSFTKLLNSSSVAHHSSVGINCQLSDGSRVAGSVTVGDHCVIGLNSTVNMKLKVGSHVTIASGVSLYVDRINKGVVLENG